VSIWRKGILSGRSSAEAAVCPLGLRIHEWVNGNCRTKWGEGGHPVGEEGWEVGGMGRGELRTIEGQRCNRN
jgi:hypothetical protein